MTPGEAAAARSAAAGGLRPAARVELAEIGLPDCRDSLVEVLDDLDRELGPPGPDAQAWADEVAAALGWR